MTSPTAPRAVYVNSRKEAALTCPSCHNTKLVNFAPYLNDKSPSKRNVCVVVFLLSRMSSSSKKIFIEEGHTPPGSYAKTKG